MRGCVAILVFGIVIACEPCTRAREDAAPFKKRHAGEVSAPIQTHALATHALGLSGLTADDRGNLWAVGEGGDVIVEINRQTLATQEHRLVDCPSHLEPEALAWVGGKRFVFGTETDEEGRKSDQLFSGRLTDRGVVFDSAAMCDYEQWKLVAPHNRGMEGICFVDGKYLCATELATEENQMRWAPLGMWDPQNEEWVAHRIRLSTSTGKLSALSCRASRDGYEAIAVERHFGVARLLRFSVPRGNTPMEITPRYVDLAPHIKNVPNFEGVVWEPDGTVVLITDNQFRGKSDRKNALYVIAAEWLANAWQELQ